MKINLTRSIIAWCLAVASVAAIAQTPAPMALDLYGRPVLQYWNQATNSFVPVSTANPLPINTGSANPTAIFSVQQTATASAVALSNQALVNSIVIVALPTNTGVVYVGPAGVTAATGYPLQPGQAIGYTVNNASVIYIVGANASSMFIHFSSSKFKTQKK